MAGERSQVDEDRVWPSPLYAEIIDELRRLGRRRANTYTGAVLEESAFTILLVLSERGPRTLRELAGDLDLEQSTVNRQVNAAIGRGYLARRVVSDQAGRVIEPTAAGREAFRHDGMLRVDRLNAVFDDLAPGDPAALLLQLRAYNNAYQRVLDAEHG